MERGLYTSVVLGPNVLAPLGQHSIVVHVLLPPCKTSSDIQRASRVVWVNNAVRPSKAPHLPHLLILWDRPSTVEPHGLSNTLMLKLWKMLSAYAV